MCPHQNVLVYEQDVIVVVPDGDRKARRHHEQQDCNDRDGQVPVPQFGRIFRTTHLYIKEKGTGLRSSQKTHRGCKYGANTCVLCHSIDW